MKKRVTDLTADELEKLASDAWFTASENALKRGAAVVGREGGHIVKTYPDGRVEILKEAAPLVSADGPERGGAKPSRGANQKRRTA